MAFSTGRPSQIAHMKKDNCCSSSVVPLYYTPSPKQGEFLAQRGREAVAGSGIPEALWASATTLLTNYEIDPYSHEVSYPLYEVLNRRFARFGNNAHKEAQKFGIGLVGDDGEIWQVIEPCSSSPKGYRYMAPRGIGNRAFFPKLDADTVAKICQKQGLALPEEGISPWSYFQAQKVPLTVTEGAKKALALLGQGILACAVYGRSCLKSEDLSPWAEKGRKILIALDEDEGKKGEETKSAARAGASHLRKKGTEVAFISWHPRYGKGIDDLLVNAPSLFWEAVNSPFYSVRKDWRKLGRVDLAVNSKFLDLDIDALLPRAKRLGIRSLKCTGKSELISNWLAPHIHAGEKILGITHRISLGQACGDRWGLPWISEDRILGQGMICIHSMHSKCKARFNPEDWRGAIVLIDEVCQVLADLVISSLIDGHRPEIFQNFREVCTTAKALIVLDADLSDAALALFEDWGIPLLTIQNDFEPEKYPIYSWHSPEALLASLLASLGRGEKALVLSDTQKNEIGQNSRGLKGSGKFSTQALEARIAKEYPELRILRVDSQTLGDSGHPAHRCLSYEGGKLKLGEIARNDFDVVIASPSINTGVDLSIPGHFANCFGFFMGVLSAPDVSQFLARLRDSNCPRHIWLKKGFNSTLTIGNGSGSPWGLIQGCRAKLRASLEVLSEIEEGTTIDASWLNLWGRIASQGNLDARAYRYTCLAWLKSEGHKILPPPQDDSPQDDAPNAPQEGQEAIALELALERAKARLEARDIEEKEALALEKKESLSLGDRDALAKFKLRKKYGGIAPSMDLILLDASVGYSALRLGFLLEREEVAAQIDRELGEKAGNGAWIPVLAKRSVRGAVALLRGMGIPSLLAQEEFSAKELGPWLERFKPYANQIKDILGISMGEKARPIPFLRAIAAKIGRSLQISRIVRGQRFYKFAQIEELSMEIYGAWDKEKMYQADTKGCITVDIDITNEPTAPSTAPSTAPQEEQPVPKDGLPQESQGEGQPISSCNAPQESQGEAQPISSSNAPQEARRRAIRIEGHWYSTADIAPLTVALERLKAVPNPHLGVIARTQALIERLQALQS